VKLFVHGFGYTAQVLADRLLPLGWHIVGTSRSSDGRARLAARGVSAVDPSHPEALQSALAATDALLLSAAPGPEGCPGYASLAPLLESGAARPDWVGYLSTTGVYGDHAGRWVFERTAVAPLSPEGERRVAAEQAWLQLGDRLGLAATIFRLPGIYGPDLDGKGRSPFARLRDGTARRYDKPGQVFSRIHVSDLAEGLVASLRRPRPGGIYNLCDDAPAPAAEVTAHAAALLGMTPPALEPFDRAELSPMARRFYGESKRVSNAQAKAELGWRPAHPTYREGLAAILDAEGRISPPPR
jgi:nucleoside-diphosphate-sugar epimerase